MSNRGYAEVIGASVRGGSRIEWFGDGRDGDLYVADGETLTLDVVEDEGQLVLRYKSVYIGYGATVKTSGRCNGLIICSRGDFVNHGTITMDKCAPMLSSTESEHLKEIHVRLCGVTGGAGGTSGTGFYKYVQTGSETDHDTTTRTSYGSTGGTGTPFGGGNGAGSGGVAVSVTAGGSGERAPVGTSLPYVPGLGEAGKYGSGGSTIDRVGGAGYGGSGAATVSSGGVVGNDGDAIGGGAIYLFVGGRFTNTGLITANGGDGADGVGEGYDYANSMYGGNGAAVSGGGGAAAGGVIAVVHNGDYTNSGSMRVDGGVGGASASAESDAYSSQVTLTSTAGRDGSAGTILITTLDELLAA